MGRLLGLFRRLNDSRYAKYVKGRPLVTNSLFYGGMYCVSDVSQQLVVSPYVTGNPRQFKIDSAFRCWIMGTFVFGPSVTTFVRFANKLIPGATFKAACKKILLDQCVMAFPMISLFYLGMNLLEGNSIETFKEEWKAKFFPSWRTGICFWPMAQMISWTRIPDIWRPSYLACCAFIWTNFLCYMKNLPVEAEGHESSDLKEDAGHPEDAKEKTLDSELP